MEIAHFLKSIIHIDVTRARKSINWFDRPSLKPKPLGSTPLANISIPSSLHGLLTLLQPLPMYYGRDASDRSKAGVMDPCEAFLKERVTRCCKTVLRGLGTGLIMQLAAVRSGSRDSMACIEVG